MGIKIGNIGFCIFIFICVLENDFWKQKLFFFFFGKRIDIHKMNIYNRKIRTRG